MKSPWTALRRFLGSSHRPRPIVRRRAMTRLLLERLEDRVVPTVVFDPAFGTEATTFGSGQKLNNTPVELIFWGSTYWNNPSGASASQIASAYSTLLGSPYYNHLSQYSAGSSPYLAGWWIDSDHGNPGSTITDSDIRNEIVNAINDTSSPIDPPSNFNDVPPLYVVVTPDGTAINESSVPELGNVGYEGGVKGGINTTVGYHYDFNASTNYGNYNLVYAWIGNYTLSGLQGTMTNLDSITSIFSHESSEAMTDSQPFSGIITSPGASLPGGSGSGEIGDYEPESYNLEEYRVDGVLAQATWDYNEQAFVVDDGNSQNFEIVPQYYYDSGNGSYTFIGNKLWVEGDQFGYGYNDTITLDSTASGDVMVTMNGETASFERGLDITSVYVLPSVGSNTINVFSTPVGVTTDILCGGSDTVNLGISGSVQGIQGDVNIEDVPSLATININDSTDTANHTVYVGNLGSNPEDSQENSDPWGYIDGLSRGEIAYEYNDTRNVTINTGTGANVVNVLGTGVVTNLVTHANATINVGDGTVAGIQGELNIESPPEYNTINIDDSTDSTSRTVTVGTLGANGYDSDGNSESWGYVSGLGSAQINYEYADTRSVTIDTGPASGNVRTDVGDNSILVLATGAPLYLNNGGVTTVWVGGVSQASTANINSLVDIYGSGETWLRLNDQSDTTARTVYAFDGEITGLAPAPIYWTPTTSSSGGVVGIDSYNGSGGNTFNIYDTSNLEYYTYFYTGTGSDTVNVFATTGALDLNNGGNTDHVYVGGNNSVSDSMANINGTVDVYGAGSTELYLDDRSDSSSRTVSIDDGSVTGLSLAAISWTPSSSSTGGVIELGVSGGTGGNTFNVNQTSNFYFYTAIQPGTGSNAVYVRNTTGALVDANTGGQDSVYVGFGSLAGINGAVQVDGSNSTFLLVDDHNDSTSRTATLTSSALTGLGNAGTIYYDGVSRLEVDSGPASGNVIDVLSTSDPVYLDDSGTTSVYVGSNGSTLGGSMANINGSVAVNGTGSTTLRLDNYADSNTHTVTMNDGSVTGLAPGTISWTDATSASSGGVHSLAVYDGSGNNTYNVDNISLLYGGSTFLESGSGNDTLNVFATKGDLTNYNLGGQDTVYLGSKGSALGGTLTNITGSQVDFQGQGLTALHVNDDGDSFSRTASIYAGSIYGLDPATNIYWTPATSSSGGVNSVTINGSKKASTYNIGSTAAGTPLTIKGGGAADTFNISDSSNTLDSIQGVVNINGGGGGNTLNIRDQGSSSGQSYTLFSTHTTPVTNTLTRSGAADVTYAALARVNINASNGGNDSLTMRTPVPTLATYFYCGSGTNTLQGANVANTWTISAADSGKLNNVNFFGFQNLIGGTSSDTFKFTGSGSVSGSITGNGGSLNKLDYSHLASTLAESVTLNNLSSGTASRVGGGISGINNVAGNSNTANTLTGPNLFNLWTITGLDKGTLKVGSTTFTFAGMPKLVGGTDVDTFKLSNATNSKELSINGGGAPTGEGDWLDYSSFSSSSTVNVNLATGSASNINGGAAGAVTGIQNVIGSSTGHNNLTGDDQGNILLGGNGTSTNRQVDTIVGGNGRSLLIGGGGGSITGGSEEDILIAGTTKYNPTTTSGKLALMAILQEWQRTDKTFAQRVTDLKSSGGYNGSNKLIWSGTGTTVHKSLGSFTLTGDPAEATTADWFFANLSGTGALSTISDFDDEPGETDQLN